MKRKLPEWMCKSNEKAKSDGLAEAATDESEEIPYKLPEEPKCTSFLSFPGKVLFIADKDTNSLKREIGLLIERIHAEHKKTKQEFPLGLDAEWAVDLKLKFTGRISLIQICPDEKIAYVIQVNKYFELPAILKELFTIPCVKLVGVRINGDIWKIGRDFRFSVQDIISNNVKDIGTYANELFDPPQTWSLQNLVRYCLKEDMDKRSYVRMSDWGNKELSVRQMLYAATDAYASLMVYKHLKNVEMKNLKNYGRAKLKTLF